MIDLNQFGCMEGSLSCKLGSFRFLPCFLLLLAAALAFGQDRGTITGSITDNSGAAVPGAKVILTNPATGFTQAVVFTTYCADGFLYLTSGTNSLAPQTDGFPKTPVA